MKRVTPHVCSGLMLGFLLVLETGCRPLTGGSADETKELNFLRGRHGVRMGDYPAAIEAFEESLQVNPNSAEAHFELGRIFSQNVKDPAAAIYHLQRFVKLVPDDGRNDTASRFIENMKHELARNVSLSTVTQHVEDELVQLQSENSTLKEETGRLREEVAQLQARLQSLQQLRELAGSSPEPQQRAPAAVERPTTVAVSDVRNQNPFKEYRIAKGDTLFNIAQRHKIPVDALKRANPRVNPRKMMPGDPIRIPRP